MHTQRNNTPIDNEATFYVDLLQVCADLLYGPEAFFSRQDINKYGGLSEDSGEHHCVIGIEQATEFLNKVYNCATFMSGSVFQHLSINPLIRNLQVRLDRLKSMRAPKVKFSAVDEGQWMKTEKHYMKFEAPHFFMTLVALTMDRIIFYQSHVATDTRQSLALIQSHDEPPTIVNMGSMRQYSATLAAYFARARYLGGFERFLAPDLRKRSAAFEKKITEFRGWQLKSQDMVAKVHDASHQASLISRYGASKAETLIADGICYLKEEDYLDSSLSSFVLDGEIADTFRASGSGSFSISSVPLVHNDNGFVIDSHYQAIWNSLPLTTPGAYGETGRDLLGALRPYDTRPVMRAKWSRIPKILIHDFHELTDIVAGIRGGFPNKQIFFRGQGEHRSLNRSGLAKGLLYDDPNVDELSLPTAASRHKFEFDSFIAAFQLQIQGILYARFAQSQFREMRPDWEGWGPVSPFTDKEVADLYEKWFRLYYSYEWELLVMGLAQHYGIPTHGLDITNDLPIAMWFALHKWYEHDKNGRKCCWYKPANRGEQPSLEKYPVLYILATDTDLKRDLDQVEYVNLPALRPIRQRAFLHYGGWGFHTNICAEDVVAAIFLSEKFKAPELPSVEWLFPGETVDPFYAQLIELKHRAIEANIGWGYHYIAEYCPD